MPDSTLGEAGPGRLRVVIPHGAYGRPDSKRHPGLAARSAAAGHEAVLPRCPTPEGPPALRSVTPAPAYPPRALR